MAKTVLIVEDERAIVEILKFNLSRAGSTPLEALDGVESAEVSHEKGTAVVTLRQDVPDETLRAAVEAQDYRVKAITVKKE